MYVRFQSEDAEFAVQAVMKQEIFDESDEDQATRAFNTIQKVPSISDLSDPEASLGKFISFYSDISELLVTSLIRNFCSDMDLHMK